MPSIDDAPPRPAHSRAARPQAPSSQPPPALLSPPQFFVEPSGILFLETARTPLQFWAPSLLRGCGSESRAVAVAGPLRPSPGSLEGAPDLGAFRPGSGCLPPRYGLRATGSGLPRLPARCCLPGCPAAAPPSPRPAPFPVMQPLRGRAAGAAACRPALPGPEHPAAALQQSLTPALPVRTFPAGFPCSASRAAS